LGALLFGVSTADFARAQSSGINLSWIAPPTDQVKPGPWAIHIYGGKLIDTVMTRIHYEPWGTKWTPATIVGVNVHRRVLTLWKHLDAEIEIGAARRFQERVWEVHAALTLRWDGFPWNRHLFTTVAVSPLGPSYADKVSHWERNQAGSLGKVSRLANVFSTEITLALPHYRNYPLVLRIHHRSQIFGLNGGASNAVSFATVGVRVHF
jgi:hypothetical protein